jgi:leucine-zipper of insertion element IS481
MSLARLVVTALRVQGRSNSQVARDDRVSRRWVHELVNRFDAQGEVGLVPRSRRPQTSPRRTPLAVEQEVVELRKHLADQGLDAATTDATPSAPPCKRMKPGRSLYARPVIVRGQHCAEARFMSSSAAQLPSHRGGTCCHCGAVIGCRAPQTLQPKRSCTAQPAVAVIVVVEDVRTPATPFVAVSASSVRRADVMCPGVRCPGDRCDPGVRTDRRPVSAAAAAALDPRTSVRRDTPRLAQWVRRVAAVGERPGRRCPNRAWRGRDGRRSAVGGWHGARRQIWAAASQAHRPRRRAGRLADQGSRSSACHRRALEVGIDAARALARLVLAVDRQRRPRLEIAGDQWGGGSSPTTCSG